MTTKVVYSVPTGVPGPPQQGEPEEVRYGLGMPTGAQQRGPGKRNQGGGRVEVERSLQEEAMEVEMEGVSTGKGKGVERGGEGAIRAPSPSMHAPKETGEPWQMV